MTPAELCAEIDSLAIKHFQPFFGSLVSVQDLWPSVTAETLLDRPMREVIQARSSGYFNYFDSRAAYSSWVKRYLNVLIPPVLLADILIGRSIVVDLPTLRFVVTETGLVGTIVISRVVKRYDEDPFERFKPLIFDHFVPLIDLWTKRTGVPSHVLWCNVGNAFEAMLRRIEAVAGRSRRSAGAQRLLDEPNWSGEQNPLYRSVRYVVLNGTTVRLRRICCLQHKLPDLPSCKACPMTVERQFFH